MNNDETGHGETHTNLAIRQAVVAGAAVGVNIPVAGIKVGDSLKAVSNLAGGGNHDPNAFTVGDGVISSATVGTGATTLLVTWISRHPLGGDLNRGI